MAGQRSFVSLLRAISSINPKQAHQTKTSNSKEIALRTLTNWIAELHRRYSPLPPGTCLTFFRLFFPEEDVSRKYGMQETKLANYLCEILLTSRSPHRSHSVLQDWQGTNAVGCLRAEVLKVVEEITSVSPH